MISDFLCNFADGIFIGTGFSLCSNALGWAMVASTVYHEFAQEMADFFLLTHTSHLGIGQALLHSRWGCVFVGVFLLVWRPNLPRQSWLHCWPRAFLYTFLRRNASPRFDLNCMRMCVIRSSSCFVLLWEPSPLDWF